MNLFIRVVDNTVIDHPVTLENLQMIYPGVDATNPPENYWPFNRAEIPALPDPYTVNEASYVISANVVNEVYTQRPMTLEEKQQLWNNMEYSRPYPSWILNKERCIWEPPVAHPADGNKYMWDESVANWTLIE